VPDELQKIIKTYMKYKKFPESKYLLHTRDKPEIKASDMNGLLKKAFGMNVGVSVFRNVFASDKYSSIVNDLAQDSKAMGTSVDVLLNTYIKKE